MYVGRLGLSWFFVNCYALFYRVGSLWHASSRTCVTSKGKVSVRPLPNTDFLSSDWFMMLLEGQPFSFGKKNFSDVVVTSHSLCVFLYLFSSANIFLVRFVLHLQDWWCVGKCETSFPVNKLWLIYLPPSLWPLTMISISIRYIKNKTKKGGVSMLENYLVLKYSFTKSHSLSM